MAGKKCDYSAHAGTCVQCVIEGMLRSSSGRLRLAIMFMTPVIFLLGLIYLSVEVLTPISPLYGVLAGSMGGVLGFVTIPSLWEYLFYIR